MFTITTAQDILSLKFENCTLFWGKNLGAASLDSSSVYLNSYKTTDSNWLGQRNYISNAGQYSQKGFEIESVILDSSASIRLLFKIKYSGVNLVLLDTFEDIVLNTDSVIDKIGEPQVLIVRTQNIKIEDVLTISQNSNPKVVVLVSKTQDNEAIKQLFTSNLTLIENGYKLRSKDIGNENTQYLILNQ